MTQTDSFSPNILGPKKSVLTSKVFLCTNYMYIHTQFGYVVVERHSAVVTDVLRFVGLTHGGIEILLTTFQTDCGDHLQVRNKCSIHTHAHNGYA